MVRREDNLAETKFKFNCVCVLHIVFVHAHDVIKQISRGKNIFHRVENVIRQLIHTSAVRSSRHEALGKFGEHSSSWSCSQLCLEQLLRIFRALQTSRVLHISMNARERMNQLLIMMCIKCRSSSSPW